MRQLAIPNSFTKRESDSLTRYFRDIDKIAMINMSEEVELCRLISMGDPAAATKLVLANLRFVISVAKQHQTKGLTLNDLINEGNLGLIRAAKKFDHTRGFRFVSFAVWWIREAMLKAIEDHTRFIHIPMNKVCLLNQYLRICSELEQKDSRSPSMEDAAKALGTEVWRLEELLVKTQATTSLDRPVNSETDMVLSDLIHHEDDCPDKSLMDESVRWEISKALENLDIRERKIINLYFGLNGEPLTRLDEIAQVVRLSSKQTGRIKDRAIQKLRESKHVHRLKSCFI
ncbi:RNA polymerase sigma factor RpoD/SigA [Mucilaginibacter sp. SMC90]|uniref:sigma-70 family RNA polymerase sigma factor n=1 Tax=Mucilaginibacter sp. SMC90 TaxID=2929803 RepID=UPI001FB1B967|nr:RNA polymerase sigma factor RpoD/SigA [Mucilaginibacter sp. SMC90]UOE48848.1 RNA polymerase sigma factor RpoD/SigA [Mucilaginibacter sp. SMC90]